MEPYMVFLDQESVSPLRVRFPRFLRLQLCQINAALIVHMLKGRRCRVQITKVLTLPEDYSQMITYISSRLLTEEPTHDLAYTAREDSNTSQSGARLFRHTLDVHIPAAS